MTALVRSTRAELLRMRKWPAVWITVGAWMLLSAMFGYLFDYIAYRTGDTSFSNDGTTTASLLAGLLPEAVPQVLLQGMPMFGGALMMVLGAILAGNGFGLGTWKTVFTQGPSRLAAVGGSLLALTLWVVGIVLATLVLDFGFASAIAAAENQTVVWPSVQSLTEGVGGGVMVLEMWALAGFLLGVIARGTRAVDRTRAGVGARGREPAARGRQPAGRRGDRDPVPARHGGRLAGRRDHRHPHGRR